MRRLYPAGTLLVTMMILVGLLAILFLNKESFLMRERVIQYYYADYLESKFKLLRLKDVHNKCDEYQKNNLSIQAGKLHYQFSCQFDSIFLQTKPETKKYIQIDNIENWLNLEKYNPEIISIKHIDELPQNSESNPKIVRALNDITGRLKHDFYGIIITDFLFDITGKQVQGTVYSGYPNTPTRYLVFNRNVINNIEQQYSQWRYQPFSRNLLAHE